MIHDFCIEGPNVFCSLVMTQQDSRKKTKLSINGVFNESLFDTQHAVKSAYDASQPFKHAVIPAMFNDSILRKVRQEILENLEFSEKETDIYKVNQTGDLLNLDKLQSQELAKLESLFMLRNAIYSEEFRHYIESVVGVKGLCSRNVDLSINNYKNGCHLLNHDDVIGSRAVSFILYLPNPDEEWDTSDGGRLELYKTKTKGSPEDEPIKSIMPHWNTFAFFAVQPRYSFHSVEEVFGPKERLSISGWFHFNENEVIGDESSAKSTLDQLLHESTMPMIEFAEDLSEMNEDDVGLLKKYLNPVYLSPDAINSIGGIFQDENSVQLHSFLNKRIESRLKQLLTSYDDEMIVGIQKHGSLIPQGWECRGPPHIMRYCTMTSGDGLLKELRAFFESIAFRKWLEIVTEMLPMSKRVEFRRFRPSLDYTLALSSKTDLLDVNLCLTTNDELWETGDVGGYLNYLENSVDNDAAVYSKVGDEGELLTTSASWNQLNIVKRQSGTLKFVKYVSASAPSSRWDIDCEFTTK